MRYLLIAFLMLSNTLFAAQDPKKGCEYKVLHPADYGGKPLQSAVELRSENGVLSTTIEVRYAYHRIAGCNTHLRNYNGKLVGPTLRVRPGQGFRIINQSTCG